MSESEGEKKPTIDEILEAAGVGEPPIAREEEAILYNFISSMASALKIAPPQDMELDWYEEESRQWLLGQCRSITAGVEDISSRLEKMIEEIDSNGRWSR